MNFNLNNVAWDSRYRYERIDIKGHVSFSGTTPISLTVNHGLGYVPYYKSYVLFNGDNHFYYISTSSSLIFYGDGEQAAVVNYSADTNNLYCGFDQFGGTLVGTFYYRIYAEPQSS